MKSFSSLREWTRTIVVLLCLSATHLDAQQSNFAKSFDDFVRQDGTVGAAYVVTDHGRITESRQWGTADRELKQLVDKDTIFHWASITKTFTAVAIMQLRDRGKLSLDDPILKWIPELRRVHSENGAIERVTIRHLLSHTAGFQGPTWPYGNGKPWEPFEPTEWSQLVAMMPYQELSFEPGAKYQYSNPGFIYLGRVIEEISGDPYETYIQKNILTPLGMTRTYFNVTPYHLAQHRANSYAIDLDASGQEKFVAYGREFDTGITTANGGLNAPLDDMAKWMGFLSGAPGSYPVLERKSLEEMWHAVAPTGPDSYAAPNSMGLSFFLFPRGDITFVGHTGHQAGFALFFLLNPKNGRAIVVATNSVHRAGEGPPSQKAARDSDARLSALMERAMQALR